MANLSLLYEGFCKVGSDFTYDATCRVMEGVSEQDGFQSSTATLLTEIHNYIHNLHSNRSHKIDSKIQ